jgi:hypothetical protein
MPVTTITVQYRSSGGPVSGASVSLTFTGGAGGVTKSVRTDARGVARIEHSSVGSANVIINGSTAGSVRCPTEASFTL